MTFGNCGNCRFAFRDNASRRTTVLSSWNKHDHPHFISVYEALAVVFEIHPLTPNVKEVLLDPPTKKDVFRRGTKFTSDFQNYDPDPATGAEEGDSGNMWGLCYDCNELLTAMYNNFQEFTAACAAESEVAKALNALRKEEERQETFLGDEEETATRWKKKQAMARTRSAGSSQPNEEENQPVVKAEPVDRSDSGSDMGDGFDHFDGGPDSPANPPPPSNAAVANKKRVDSIEEENDSNNEASPRPPRRRGSKARSEAENISEGDQNKENDEASPSTSSYSLRSRPRRSSTKSARISYREYSSESEEEERVVPKPVVTPVRSGLTNIKQLKCPRCEKTFLHANVLACHRRIIHGDRILLSPPSPMPQLPFFQTSKDNYKEALAESSGKTSTCPVCRLEVPRTQIRNHLSKHTRSIEKPWLCTICGKETASQESLVEHCKIHQACVPCHRCGRRVARLEMLNHLSKCGRVQATTGVIGKPPPYFGPVWNCKLCKVRFTNRAKMLEHMELHRQKRAFPCKICDKTFSSLAIQRLHVKRFHRNNDSGPPSVRSRLGDEDDFHDDDDVIDVDPLDSSNGQQQGTGTPLGPPAPPKPKRPRPGSQNYDLTPIVDNRYLCKVCKFQAQEPKDMEAHMREAHADPATLTCNICSRTLQDDFCLNLHLNSHSESRPLECFICKKNYTQKNGFFYHLKETHAMETKSIIIKYPQTFSVAKTSSGVRIKGQRMNHPPKKGEFPCETCGKVFFFLHAVRNHRKLVHEKVREFICSYCGKSFPRKSYFLVHEKLHTSTETPYKCHLCSKGFRLPGNLRMHLQSTIHNPDRNFVCDVCGKSFNRKDNLRLHVRAVHLKICTRKTKNADQTESRGGRGRKRVYGIDIDPLPLTVKQDYPPPPPAPTTSVAARSSVIAGPGTLPAASTAAVVSSSSSSMAMQHIDSVSMDDSSSHSHMSADSRASPYHSGSEHGSHSSSMHQLAMHMPNHLLHHHHGGHGLTQGHPAGHPSIVEAALQYAQQSDVFNSSLQHGFHMRNQHHPQ